MSFLDLYERDQRADAAIQPQEGRDLPAEFTDAFSASWSNGYLFGQSVAGQNARHAAMVDYVTSIEKQTGKKIPIPTEPEGQRDPWAYLKGQVAKLKESFPDIDDPPSDDELEQRAIRKSQNARGEYAAMAAREKTLGGSIGFGLGGLTGAAADPINIVALPVAPAEGLGILATAARWAMITGTSQTAIEATGAPFHEKVQPGYVDSGAPIQNIIEAAGGGAVLGGGIRGLGNIWTRMKTGAWPRSVRDAGNIAESEANVLDTNRFEGVEGEVAHRSALQDSIESLINGRPIDVDQHVTPSILAAYEQKLSPIMDARSRAVTAEESAFMLERDAARLPPTMERLSEVQLGEIRASHVGIEADAEHARAGLAEEATSIEAARGPLAEQQRAVEGLRADVESARAEVASAKERLGAARPVTDETTQARLSAIEEELGAPALSSARKAELMAERASITETLAKTAKEDSRRIASLEQEHRALEKVLARQEKAIAKAEAAAAKAEQKLSVRAARLPRRQEAIESRATSQKASIGNEMRRTIGRLAQDGYGVRLSTEEAQALADRVLSAPDKEADAALREVTEALVDRSVGLRRAQPELPGFERPVPEVQERAKAGYWTEEMRKGITALAREVGYEMPRDEAASIAAAISKLPEDQALAVLDEMMLRPRTITESLPGTLSAKMVRPEEAPPIVPGQPETAAALAQEMSPKRLEELRRDPELDDTILRDLDRLRAEKGDIEIPMGETVGPSGERTVQTRKVDDVLAEADERLAAAKEIEACAGPQPEAAE